VREAIMLLFDAEWVNRNFYFDQLQRTTSFFEGSELSAHGRPADDLERKLLEPYPDAVRPSVMDGTWSPPKTDGSGRDRDTLRRALSLLRKAGWELSGTRLRSIKSGLPFTFEILVSDKEQERLAIAFRQHLDRAGISMQVRMVDAVQYDRRRVAFDYDMIEYRWSQSLSPGNEQAFYWGSDSADQQGSRNYMGVRSPAVDALIGEMLTARDRDDFVSTVRALDRVLISGHYVIPLFHRPQQWVARWTHVRHPDTTSLFGYLPESWWHAKP